jgi:hypothetical protein
LIFNLKNAFMKSRLINKYFFLAAAMLAFTGITSCEKSYSAGDDYNISPTLPGYVELASKSTIHCGEGANITATIQVRTAKQEDITVNYEISGAFTQAGTILLKRNDMTAKATIAIPVNIIPAGSTSAMATLKLVSATANKYNLAIGQLSPESETVPISIEK